MLLIANDNTDIYFNLAAEDYMLHHLDEDVLMFWRAENAVVCGKHQNLCAEINYGYCMENGIRPARRLSGGGTVFHDPGNINFTFIQHLTEGVEKAIDFRRFLGPMRDALHSLGVMAEFSERNDLLLYGKKISGNAEHVFQRQKKVLHHGTLLFNADLTHLKTALHSQGKFEDKAVKSVRSEVTNIQSVLPSLTPEDFIEKLLEYWDKQKHTNRYVFCGKDVDSIMAVREEKYATNSWIVDYSPKYTLSRPLGLSSRDLTLHLRVENGFIHDAFLTDINDTELRPAFLKIIIGKIMNHLLSMEFAAELAQFIGHEIDPYILY